MQPSEPHIFGSLMTPSALATRSPPFDGTRPNQAPLIKIIDWTAVGWATLEFVVCGLLGVLELGSKQGLSIILLPSAMIAFAVVVQKLVGTVFDPNLGVVRFFSFGLPRRVILSEIRDANCEFATAFSPARITHADQRDARP